MKEEFNGKQKKNEVNGREKEITEKLHIFPYIFHTLSSNTLKLCYFIDFQFLHQQKTKIQQIG